MARAVVRASRRAQQPLKFHRRLVLSRWILGLFDAASFEELAADLKGAHLEGLDEDNVSNFHQALRLRLFERKELSHDLLLAYDQNIVRHWRQITERRNAEEKRLLKFKYFQYLTLLFTEVYLDRWFRDPDELLSDLNAHVAAFNEDKPQGDRVDEYAPEDLRKLAFWNATGSGKTLLMHVNILQYRHYLEQHGRAKELNRIILLTPNEGVSPQHPAEFPPAGMDADIFSIFGMRLSAGKTLDTIAAPN